MCRPTVFIRRHPHQSPLWPNRYNGRGMARFPGVDYLEFDSLLSEDELLVRQTARQFVDDQILPVVRDSYRDGIFPKQLIAEMSRLGFFGANLEGYGCPGLNNVEYGLI